jgi:hypothetical protein
MSLLFILVLAFGVSSQAVAQENGDQGKPVVILDRLDDSLFPQVTAYVAVADAHGLPILGLTRDNFLVFEDRTPAPAGAPAGAGVPTPVETVLVESAAAEQLRLVLALDISTTNETLADIQQAAKALLDGLGPRDRTALITFGDAVEIVYPLTNNQDELRATIDELRPEGNFTSLNEALRAGISLLGELEAGRKGVVVLTDRTDNIGVATEDNADVMLEAQTAQVPLYLFGVGSKVQADILNNLSGSTGGLSKTLDSSDELPAELQTLGVLLRQMYRVTFESALAADDARHALAIAVRYGGQESRPVETNFTAYTGQVTVILPGIFDGQTIEGPVRFDPQIVARAPIARVEYWLDDQLLLELSEPPYDYTWDSRTTQSGMHSLVVRVMDTAGNEGQASLNLEIDIPPSLVVTASTVQAKVKIGQEASIQAGVNPQEEVADVEFYLDDTFLGSDNLSPYSYSFDTAVYEAGQHTVKIVALDRAGQRVESSLTLEFLEVPATERFLNSLNVVGAWLGIESDLSEVWPQLLARASMILIGLILIIAIILVAVRLIRRILLARKSEHQRMGQVQIYNLGNIRSRYELLAVDPAGALKFQFIMPPVAPIEEAEPAYQPAVSPIVTPARPVQTQSMAAMSQPQAAPAPRPGQQAAAAGSAGQSAARPVNVSGSLKSAQGKLSVLNTVSDILGTVAGFLPGAAGAPLREAANSLRQTSAQANQAINQPKQAMAAAGSVRAKAASLAPKGGVSSAGQNTSPGARSAPAAPRPAPPASGPPPRPAPTLRPTPGPPSPPAAPVRPAAPPPSSFASSYPPAPAARATPAPTPPLPAPPPPAAAPTPAPVSTPTPPPAPMPGPASSAPTPVPASRRGSRYSRSRQTQITSMPAAASSIGVATLPVDQETSDETGPIPATTPSTGPEPSSISPVSASPPATPEATAGGVATPEAPVAIGAPVTTGGAAAGSAPAVIEAGGAGVEAARQPVVIPRTARHPEMATQSRAQTPFVESGEVLTVDLIITPIEPYKRQDCAFLVSSRAVEQAEAEPVVEQGQIHIAGVSLLGRILPFLLSLIILITTVGLIGGLILLMINVDILSLPFLRGLAGLKFYNF